MRRERKFGEVRRRTTLGRRISLRDALNTGAPGGHAPENTAKNAPILIDTRSGETARKLLQTLTVAPPRSIHSRCTTGPLDSQNPWLTNCHSLVKGRNTHSTLITRKLQKTKSRAPARAERRVTCVLPQSHSQATRCAPDDGEPVDCRSPRDYAIR